jgi:uncharacterized membrane protein YeaQ/YmgE (transglycosylase-associated protein family)
MHMQTQDLFVIVFIGIVAGWLAGLIMRGAGFGVVGDLIIGIAGAFVGSWLLPQLHVHFGDGMVAAVLNATIGAVLLLFVIAILRGTSGYRRI